MHPPPPPPLPYPLAPPPPPLPCTLTPTPPLPCTLTPPSPLHPRSASPAAAAPVSAERRSGTRHLSRLPTCPRRADDRRALSGSLVPPPPCPCLDPPLLGSSTSGAGGGRDRYDSCSLSPSLSPRRPTYLLPPYAPRLCRLSHRAPRRPRVRVRDFRVHARGRPKTLGLSHQNRTFNTSSIRHPYSSTAGFAHLPTSYSTVVLDIHRASRRLLAASRCLLPPLPPSGFADSRRTALAARVAHERTRPTRRKDAPHSTCVAHLVAAVAHLVAAPLCGRLCRRHRRNSVTDGTPSQMEMKLRPGQDPVATRRPAVAQPCIMSRHDDPCVPLGVLWLVAGESGTPPAPRQVMTLLLSPPLLPPPLPLLLLLLLLRCVLLLRAPLSAWAGHVCMHVTRTVVCMCTCARWHTHQRAA